MAETFKLPASSYEELLKLFQAYSAAKEGTSLSLDDVSQSTGISRTIVSANNGFLVQIGLITEGNKKAATEIGRMLGRAYTSKIVYEIERIWTEITSENEFLNRMVSAVRIRSGMDRTSFLNHIVYSSGLKDTKQNRAGAGAIIEILKNVNILNEEDGKLTVIDKIAADTQDKVTPKNIEANMADNETKVLSTSISTSNCSVIINVNINCEANDVENLGEKLKKLLNDINE